MNTIPEKQNSSDFQRLLRARQRKYYEARNFQVVRLISTVLTPFLAGLVAIFYSDLRPYTAAVSVILTVVDIAILDRLERTKVRVAALISEQFDCELLDMPWNAFVAGRMVDPEEIERASTLWKGDPSILLNWYPAAISRAPVALARIICQRSNLRFDSELRKQYSFLLLAFSSIVVLVLIAVAVVNELKFLDFVVTSIVPAAPILVWAVRERLRQNDTAAMVLNIKLEAEKFWDAAVTNAANSSVWLERSRAFQDAILLHRRSSPLIFPFIYDLMRSKLETEMVAGAEEMLNRIGIR
ncbi:MAG: hypothetical protein GC166_00675 [Alphaproteobacteria bacterium]|nr:hypothetical protein [Alphaproteobacteria bacterium]